jgi:hypothetical protein
MRLEPVCRATPPLILALQTPHRFMQTDIVVLPLDPHGPIRALHDGIARSGLRFARPKHAFTPHVTLSFHRSLEPREARQLLAVRIKEPIRLDAIRCSLTNDPMPPRTLIEIPLGTREPA